MERMAAVEEQLRQHAQIWRLAPLVQALQALRGVQFHVAVTIAAELGDITRFEKPRQLMAYVGLHPSEYSSGGTRRQGGIAKTGNAHATAGTCRENLVLPTPGVRLTSDPAAPRSPARGDPRYRLESPTSIVCSLSENAGARQESQPGDHGHRAGTDCLHVGHRQEGSTG